MEHSQSLTVGRHRMKKFKINTYPPSTHDNQKLINCLITVFNSSGPGIYVESVPPRLPLTRTDFVCEFVISVEREDLEFVEYVPPTLPPCPPEMTTNSPNSSKFRPDKEEMDCIPATNSTVPPPTASSLPVPPAPFFALSIPQDENLYVKMVQGFVNRSGNEGDFEILEILMEVNIPKFKDFSFSLNKSHEFFFIRQPMNPTPPLDLKDSFYEIHAFEKPLNLSGLSIDREVANHTWHER